LCFYDFLRVFLLQNKIAILFDYKYKKYSLDEIYKNKGCGVTVVLTYKLRAKLVSLDMIYSISTNNKPLPIDVKAYLMFN